ncbi:MAG: PilZ domain-containing protein [Firmicutes bacterium]|nr:PilZ domain-containing protein [Bacillota bacterium]
MSSERRQFVRIPMGTTVEFQELTFSGVPDVSQSVFKDVSGGGLLLHSQREFPLGTLMKLEIQVPGWGRYQKTFGPAWEKEGRPLGAVGQVVRVEQLDEGGFELGIKFLNVYPDDWVALLNFIEAATRDSNH